MEKMKSLFDIKKQDLLASFVVFIIALPLSLGIAIASGMPPESGLITAAIGGILVGIFSGAPLMVSGPAAGLTVLAYQAVATYGVLGLAAAMAICGVVQVVFGFLRLGKVFTLIPGAVLYGMLAAIGLIILLGQIHVMVGEHIPSSPLLALEMLYPSLQQGLSHEIHFVTPVLAVGLLAVVLQILWPRLVPKLKWIPSALPAVVVATLVSLFWEMDRLSVDSLVPTAEEGARIFMYGWIDHLDMFIVLGLGFALVASAESLLTARATDLLAQERDPEHEPRHNSNLNKELVAQGVGNLASSVLGGLPMSGVIVRSSANIAAGARTRWSTILHGVWILLFILMIPQLLNQIPLTALAAVLVVTGIKLLNLDGWYHAFQKRPADGVIWLFTMGAIACTDLLTGLILALGFALFVNFWTTNVRQMIKDVVAEPKKIWAFMSETP